MIPANWNLMFFFQLHVVLPESVALAESDHHDIDQKNQLHPGYFTNQYTQKKGEKQVVWKKYLHLKSGMFLSFLRDLFGKFQGYCWLEPFFNTRNSEEKKINCHLLLGISLTNSHSKLVNLKRGKPETTSLSVYFWVFFKQGGTTNKYGPQIQTNKFISSSLFCNIQPFISFLLFGRDYFVKQNNSPNLLTAKILPGSLTVRPWKYTGPQKERK